MNALKRLPALAMAALAVCATVGLCGCDKVLDQTTVSDAEEQIAKERSSELATPTINESGCLTVGLLTSETAPLLVQDGTSVSGVEIDVASALADELGLRVRFVNVSSVDDAAESGCDVVMGAEAGDSDDYTVVGSYAERAIAVMCKGEEGSVAAADLAGKKVGLQVGSASQRALEETGIELSEQSYSNINEAIEALQDGTVDYVVCDAYAGAYLATAYTGIRVGGTIDAPSPIGIAVSATNSQLSAAVSSAMDSLSSNGLLELIRNRWVGDMSALAADSQISGLASSEDGADATSTDDAAASADQAADAGDESASAA